MVPSINVINLLIQLNTQIILLQPTCRSVYKCILFKAYLPWPVLDFLPASCLALPHDKSWEEGLVSCQAVPLGCVANGWPAGWKETSELVQCYSYSHAPPSFPLEEQSQETTVSKLSHRNEGRTHYATKISVCYLRMSAHGKWGMSSRLDDCGLCLHCYHCT